MKNLMIAGAVFASATMMVPTEVRAQSACTPIETIPATISEPGNYCMVANATVDITSGAAITIAADHVTLDCRDFTLLNEASSSTGASRGIVAESRYNLLVRNCRVVGGFTDAIALTQPQSGPNSTFYNRIEDNYILGPYRYGILAYGSAIEVRDNQIYDVGGQSSGAAIGIRVGAASTSQARFQVVERNLVAGTTGIASNGFGIYSDASIGSIFRENTITGTYGADGFTSTGIRVASGSGLTLTNNHVLGRGRTNEIGIRVPDNGGLCFHNRIGVSQTATMGCNAALGNY